MDIKIRRKYTSNLRQMAFGGDQQEESLVEVLTYDEKGRLLESRKWEMDGAIESNQYVYNDDGKIIEHSMRLETEDVFEKFVFERDSKGRLISENKFYGDDAGEKTVYEYGDWDTPIRITRYDADGELESIESLEHDASGNLISHKKSDAAGVSLEQTFITYDSNSKPISKSVVDSQQVSQSVAEIVYDDQGRVVRATDKNASGMVVSDVISQYDERGNVVLRKIRDFNSRILRFEYNDQDQVLIEEVLDGNGNLIMRNTMEYDEHGNLLSESEFWLDTGRGRGDGNSVSRFEYEFF